MSYQVGARENVDVAAQEPANILSPLVGVGVLVECDARNVPPSQKVTNEMRRRVLVAEDDNGAALLNVIRDGVQQVQRLSDLADPDEFLVYVWRNLEVLLIFTLNLRLVVTYTISIYNQYPPTHPVHVVGCHALQLVLLHH